jgi:hypothetical protein
MAATLPTPVTEYIEASNAFDGERLISAFADDALVSDARREFWGVDSIKRWSDREWATALDGAQVVSFLYDRSTTAAGPKWPVTKDTRLILATAKR